MRITPNPPFLVKRGLAIARLAPVLCAFIGAVALGSPPTSAPAEPSKPNAVGIRARKFKVRVVRSNSSKRVYLFDDLTHAPPPVGKIFLLKKDGSPVMAFRTLKIYDKRSQIAAHKLKVYESASLEGGNEYTAIEKLGDVLSAELSDADKSDLEELENPESQAKKTETAQPAPGPTTDLPLEDFPDDEELVGQEMVQLDTELNWLSLNLGVLGNYNLTTNSAGQAVRGSSVNYASLGLRYARTVRSMLLFKSKDLQDSLVVDGGFYFYRIVNYTASSDSYSVMPLILTARYNLFFGETFGAFAYLGLLKNAVLTAQNSSQAALDNLNGWAPAAGLGLLFRIGPSWMLRADLGIELLGAGLVLRF